MQKYLKSERKKEAKGKSGVGGIVSWNWFGGFWCRRTCSCWCSNRMYRRYSFFDAWGLEQQRIYAVQHKIDEGLQDMSKMESGDFSESYNLVRDGMCGKFDNKQAVYNTVMYGSVMIGLGVTLSPLAGEIPAASKESGLAGRSRCLQPEDFLPE